jgi:hypothetical protein
MVINSAFLRYSSPVLRARFPSLGSDRRLLVRRFSTSLRDARRRPRHLQNEAFCQELLTDPFPDTNVIFPGPGFA